MSMGRRSFFCSVASTAAGAAALAKAAGDRPAAAEADAGQAMPQALPPAEESPAVQSGHAREEFEIRALSASEVRALEEGLAAESLPSFVTPSEARRIKLCEAWAISTAAFRANASAMRGQAAEPACGLPAWSEEGFLEFLAVDMLYTGSMDMKGLDSGNLPVVDLTFNTCSDWGRHSSSNMRDALLGRHCRPKVVDAVFRQVGWHYSVDVKVIFTAKAKPPELAGGVATQEIPEWMLNMSACKPEPVFARLSAADRKAFDEAFKKDLANKVAAMAEQYGVFQPRVDTIGAFH